MERVVLQDMTTLEGPGGATAVSFYQQKGRWLWAARADNVVLTVEILEMKAATTEPSLIIETAPDAGGPWTTVDSWNAPGTHTLFLGREPTYAADQQVQGFLRWRLAEVANGGAWTACFRITAVIEPPG